MNIVIFITYLLFAYGCGSIPTGYLAGKWLKGIDIREVGSGSTGATNVLRTLGKLPAIIVLLIDALKGAIPLLLVKLSGDYLPQWTVETGKDWLIIASAMMAILGHSRSIFLNFTGGKSVATTLGVLFVMNPWVALSALGTFGLVISVTKIVSISSIIGALMVMATMTFFQGQLPYLIFAFITGIYVIVRHRSNIERLLAGTEPRIGEKVESVNN